jgi:hypothetical protein
MSFRILKRVMMRGTESNSIAADDEGRRFIGSRMSVVT